MATSDKRHDNKAIQSIVELNLNEHTYIVKWVLCGHS